MNIKKLLFATQFEVLWFDALHSLLDLKAADLNHVVFLNVIEREKVALRRGSGYQKKEEIKLREKANIRFIDWAETLPALHQNLKQDSESIFHLNTPSIFFLPDSSMDELGQHFAHFLHLLQKSIIDLISAFL